jgi:hypothetical protein
MHGTIPPLSQMPAWYVKVQHDCTLLTWHHLDTHTHVCTFTDYSKYIDIVYGLNVQNVFCGLRIITGQCYVLFLKIWTPESVLIQWPLSPYFQHVTRCPVIICVIVNEILKFFFYDPVYILIHIDTTQSYSYRISLVISVSVLV